MNNDQFWAIIDKAIKRCPEDLDDRNRAIEYLLGTLPPGGWREFGKVYHQIDIAAYTRALRGAACEINGGCSDDGFDDFRAWLISQGRAVYDAALANPDSLADHVDPDEDAHENEDFLDIATKRIEPGDVEPNPADPSGDDWDFDDEAEMQQRYPRLCGVAPPASSEPPHTPPPPTLPSPKKGPTPPPLPPPLPPGR